MLNVSEFDSVGISVFSMNNTNVLAIQQEKNANKYLDIFIFLV